jgi:hypothetical protein
MECIRRINFAIGGHYHAQSLLGLVIATLKLPKQLQWRASIVGTVMFVECTTPMCATLLAYTHSKFPRLTLGWSGKAARSPRMRGPRCLNLLWVIDLHIRNSVTHHEYIKVGN